jgi:hypothetical protein
MADREEKDVAVRASDAERERTVDALRAAAGDGRLTLEELAERLDHALVARTRAELEPLTADLPAPAASPEPGREGTRWTVSVMSGNDLEIEGPPPQPGAPVVRVRAFSLMGGTDVKTKARRRGAPSSGGAPALRRPR